MRQLIIKVDWNKDQPTPTIEQIKEAIGFHTNPIATNPNYFTHACKVEHLQQCLNSITSVKIEETKCSICFDRLGYEVEGQYISCLNCAEGRMKYAEIEESRKRGQEQIKFNELMEARYGPDWRTSQMKMMVVGFMFSLSKKKVLMLQKTHPDWQKGKMNGIGGHVKDGETPQQAMAREMKEEAGLDLEPERFQECIVVRGISGQYNLTIFRAFGNDVFDFETKTDEVVSIVDVSAVANGTIYIDNLKWIVPMLLDKNISFPITMTWDK